MEKNNLWKYTFFSEYLWIFKNAWTIIKNKLQKEVKQFELLP